MCLLQPACICTGLAGSDGKCCVAWSDGGPPQLDRHGACCGSGIDACGTCGGNATLVDISGG